MIDVIVVLVYFAFLIAIGFLFQKFNSDTSDYFRGGGKMLWWMVGATAFMNQFSAILFTASASRAFVDGWAVTFMSFANALGYFFGFVVFAEKARQMRIITPIEGIRQRFGKVNEQVFTWATLPTSVLQGATWLNGLAIFVTAVFGIQIEYTIIATGLVVLIMSACGGAWAVIASDFVQMLIVMIVTFVSTVVAIFKAGGVGVIMEKGMPEHAIMGTGINYTAIFLAWFVCVFIKQCFSTNNMLDSYRYLCAKDSANAKKAALLACILMAIGPIIWFMPAWYMAAFHPDTTTWEVVNMGSRIKESVILVFMRKTMPVGMVGVMMSAMFAATMSSMDSALNKNAGIFVKNFYKKVINKNANEEKEMFISKVATIVFGLLVIAVALFLNSLKNLSLFDIMMYIGTLVAFPLLIPSLLGFFIKKTPDWAAWATVLVGLCVSYTVTVIITPTAIQEFLGLAIPFTKREAADLPVVLGVVGHILITGGFFVCSQFFYKGLTPEREAEVADFFKRVDTPVIADEAASVEIDNGQRIILGKLLKVFGLSAVLLCFVPNPLGGRMVFLSIAIILYLIGYALVKSAKPVKKAMA